MEQKQKIEGAGSLWNVNSWHWEAKDYTPDTKELLTKEITGIVLEKDGIKITNKKIKNWEGKAEICIRKQKQIFIYDLNLEIEWLAESEEHEATGVYKINDINPDDLDFTIDHVKSDEKTSISKDAERLIKKEMKKHYDNILKDFAVNFIKKQAEKNPERIKEDAAKRQANNQAIQKAREENGGLKQQIFDQQKQKEQDMKQQNSQWKE